MDEKEKKIQTALGTLYPVSILVTTGSWYTVYSSDQKQAESWLTVIIAAMDAARASSTINPHVHIGSLHINTYQIVMVKLGMSEPEALVKVYEE